MDPTAFTKVMRMGAKDAAEIEMVLRSAGTNTAIRVVSGGVGNQVTLTAGNASRGLLHIVGRHLTGTIPRNCDLTFFSNTLKVGDIVDLVSNTISRGIWTVSNNSNRVYVWKHPKWGNINVIVNHVEEVISAYPDK